MSRRITWSLLLAVVLATAVLTASMGEDGITAFLRHDKGALLIKVVFAIVVGGIAFAMYREKLSKALEATLFWGVLGLLLVVGYRYRYELRDVGERVIAELVPGYVAGHGGDVEVVRSRGGDFAVSARVNGARVPMVLDTGASSVVLTRQAAKAAGLPIEVLNYTVMVDTANGRTRAAPVTLDRIDVGSVSERAVPALVAQTGELQHNLLGMSFMNRLESWTVRGDTLHMRAAAN